MWSCCRHCSVVCLQQFPLSHKTLANRWSNVCEAGPVLIHHSTILLLCIVGITGSGTSVYRDHWQIWLPSQKTVQTQYRLDGGPVPTGPTFSRIWPDVNPESSPSKVCYNPNTHSAWSNYHWYLHISNTNADKSPNAGSMWDQHWTNIGWIITSHNNAAASSGNSRFILCVKTESLLCGGLIARVGLGVVVLRFSVQHQ